MTEATSASTPIFAGLTGSIGMGKSTTAQMFRDAGIPVYDADATVHDLYAGEAVAPMEAAFPGVTIDGAIDRNILRERVVGNEAEMKRLEAVIHPLVRERELAFRARIEAERLPLAILDSPLLFEMGGAASADHIIVVTCDPDIQRDRVMARPGMTPEVFGSLLARQMPDAKKRERADTIIDTGLGMDHARQAVADLIAKLTAQQKDA
ncbi:dephospho-CoA kinase [Ahrensia sp. R2A130]|uniref:dephospho-CoA kinase n=1 Tax=Ahrensia sp. R2A130 TaxID=744979 RepID=UPI0001E0AC99|nr:dephospho-CoA kinase [Ahrensia sp. R2A130]EFL89706.1 dephospho-CoA kinase [Ahrensia sp. R2A130]